MKKILNVFLGMICMVAVLGIKTTAKADIYFDSSHIDGSQNIIYNGNSLKEVQYNGAVVWRAGAEVTYCIDSSRSNVKFVSYGASTLDYTASKMEYEFVGWRKDKTASADVLTTDTMRGEPETLYAVFRKAVTVNVYNGSTTKTKHTEYLYYNNGNISYPKFTIGQASLSGWTARGWSTSTAGSASASYTSINNMEVKSDITLYGLYQKNVTLSYNGNGATGGSVESQTGTAYYNSSGNTSNPSFTLKGNSYTKRGCTFGTWAQGSSGGTKRSPGASVTLSADTVFYAVWSTDQITVTFNLNGGTAGGGTRTVDAYAELGSVPDASWTESYNISGHRGTVTTHVFDGWYTEASGGSKISASTTVSGGNVTYYAHWSAVGNTWINIYDNEYLYVENGSVQKNRELFTADPTDSSSGRYLWFYLDKNGIAVRDLAMISSDSYLDTPSWNDGTMRKLCLYNAGPWGRGMVHGEYQMPEMSGYTDFSKDVNGSWVSKSFPPGWYYFDGYDTNYRYTSEGSGLSEGDRDYSTGWVSSGTGEMLLGLVCYQNNSAVDPNNDNTSNDKFVYYDINTGCMRYSGDIYAYNINLVPEIFPVAGIDSNTGKITLNEGTDLPDRWYYYGVSGEHLYSGY